MVLRWYWTVYFYTCIFNWLQDHLVRALFVQASAHFRVLNINTSHSNFWHKATKFKRNRPDLHIVTVKNWMLQLPSHCFTQTNWKLNVVLNNQIQQLKKWILHSTTNFSNGKKLHVEILTPLLAPNTLKIECCNQQSNL